MAVQELQREVIVVLGNTRELAAIDGEDFDWPVASGDLQLGFGQRIANRRERALAADIGKIGTGNSAAASNHVARSAAALFLEDTLAAACIPGDECVRGGGPETS